MTDTDNAARIIAELAASASGADHLTPGEIYAYQTTAGPKLVDLTGEQYLELPRRKRGTVTVDNVASFARYYGKHSDDDSEVFADREAGRRRPGPRGLPAPRLAAFDHPGPGHEPGQPRL